MELYIRTSVCMYVCMDIYVSTNVWICLYVCTNLSRHSYGGGEVCRYVLYVGRNRKTCMQNHKYSPAIHRRLYWALPGQDGEDKKEAVP